MSMLVQILACTFLWPCIVAHNDVCELHKTAELVSIVFECQVHSGEDND
jgi:hypothetical protein